MTTTTVGEWSHLVDIWNRQSPAYRRQIAEECKREGHVWIWSPSVVFCQRCTSIDLTASEDEAA